jgi:glycosyltransferase involved in cell wall biosynthesis
MTASTERSRFTEGPPGGLDAGWRAARQHAQELALPPGRVAVSSQASPGKGGIGRHLQEILDALHRAGRPAVEVESSLRAPRDTLVRALSTAAPLLWLSPGLRTWRGAVVSDRLAARRLPQAEHLIAFNAEALASFDAAASSGYQSLSLVSATAHMAHVIRQHALAYAQYPLERSWATYLLRRSLREYARADRILVSTPYVRESFLREGVPAEKLVLFPLTPAPRYRPEAGRGEASTFDIVYVGGISVVKGVPLLLEAVGRLPQTDIRVLLVGGVGSRGMRRFVEQALTREPRLRVFRGDPLPHLRSARLYVHATYSDGFGYAPAEALACGVPVILSEDTGARELVEQGSNGVVVPSGDAAALTAAIEAAYRGEIAGG